ncbi:RNA polymerase sigma factor [Streptomyces dysideae]|uniref:RNA polymerase sigma factor 70 region 4 type 2 domain-containing protein n=1 Tax=Streptomyces dysideae TaxID=909626 RepID=A0A101UPK1_9ACTN|nr:sigma factor-like helix-turn-helix DNA-binding protein [Streptomyces dysideae]KUO14426.1 hypothetical protein AQJ91_46875 [Streptomyces dysideae]
MSRGKLSAVWPAAPFGTPLVGKDFDGVVDEALAALPLKHQRVARLVDFGGLSQAEAAGLLGVSEGTVVSRLRRACRRRRTRLAAAGLVPG